MTRTRAPIARTMEMYARPVRDAPTTPMSLPWISCDGGALDGLGPRGAAVQGMIEAVDAVQQGQGEGEGHLGHRPGHLVPRLRDMDAAPEHLLVDVRGHGRSRVRDELQPVSGVEEPRVDARTAPRGDECPCAGEGRSQRRTVPVLVQNGQLGRRVQLLPDLGGEELGAQVRGYGDDHAGAAGRIGHDGLRGEEAGEHPRV
ncbi:hypothetical protein [Streptomyces sp. NBC_00887]|uniref:hypothetical protein n=1 Tax=Streptomyces sp. NBC_00887 TaxID=2975859 RepID=UPI0038646726|nr:hypothetical protein OG844_05955 [Streptomyces sp. NBC_00887]WSY36887.1 hypothetical protein OG844_39645 [Streptomyces sp. NBC_00887]